MISFYNFKETKPLLGIPLFTLYLFCILLTGNANPEDSSLVRKTFLKGRAVLPAATFSAGPTSGKMVFPKSQNGQTLPLMDKQPIQGFSAILKESDTSYWAMCDNGFGTMENSADFNLRVYNIIPHFKTAFGGTGEITIKNFIELRDPDSLIPFSIVNQYSTQRILTGADFDIESMQKAKDNTLWFGDEFGPYLIHTDSTGKVLEEPYVLPDPYNTGKEIRSPQNQNYEEASGVRIMNAMNANIMKNGGTKMPVLSPNYNLIDDKDTLTGLANRINPAAGSGLTKTSSEIFNIASIQSAGYPVVAWTVNDSARIINLIKAGVKGVISDNPELLNRLITRFDGDSNGIADFIDADGLIDVNLFDAQSHRGGRSLRPENTLPAMEHSLDLLSPTLETDCGVTSDGVVVLSHDPYLSSTKFRKADGSQYTITDEVMIKDITLTELQTNYIGDKLLGTIFPDQKNDKSLSPVSSAFADSIHLIDPYIAPSLQQLFDFIRFYSHYYKTGPGKTHPLAALRSKNADRIRFNIETKRNPRSDVDAKGKAFRSRTIEAAPFAKAVADVIVSNKLTERADIQSFDFNTLVIVHSYAPQIRTVFLFSDGPVVPGGSEDGTNLQPEPNGLTSPWLAGLYWPYRSNYHTTPALAQRSGGFEGMALDSLKENLLPLLELPLLPISNEKKNPILMFKFKLASKSFSNEIFKYNFHPRGTNIGDFVMYTQNRGLIIERDGSQGTLDGFKAAYEIQLNDAGESVSKRLVADLLNIHDSTGITTHNPDETGLGERFGFPFTTIEDVVILGPSTIGILNDNNYPGSVGRHTGKKLADDNEFIILELNRKLGMEPMTENDTIGFYPEIITGNQSNIDASYIISARPNPFNEKTTVSLHLNSFKEVHACVINSLGKEIKTWPALKMDVGQFELEWLGNTDENSKVPPGIYHLQLIQDGKIHQYKLMVLE